MAGGPASFATPGLEAAVKNVDSMGDDIGKLRTQLDSLAPTLKDWKSRLTGSIHPTLKKWSATLDALEDPDRIFTPLAIRNAISGTLPLPAGTPTSRQLEFAFATATDRVLAEWHEIGDRRREARNHLQQYFQQLKNGSGPTENDALVSSIVRQILEQFQPGFTALDNGAKPHWDQAFHLKELRLTNIGPFSDLRLEAPEVASDSGQWIIIVGDNARGKSTLLRAIALLLIANKTATALLETKEIDYLHGNSTKGSIELKLQHGAETRAYNLSLQREFPSERETQGESALEQSSGLPVFAYGTQRGTALGGLDRDVNLGRIDAVKTLFDPQAHLVHASTWLQQRKLEALQNPAAEGIYQSIIAVLLEILPHVTNIDVVDGRVLIEGLESQPTQLGQLSDGYLTTLGWIVDLLARWINWAKAQNMPVADRFHQHMTGIVLVDEIDLHLHPQWQTSVIRKVRSLFPRLSFVVTTHSPLVLFGALEGEIFVLRKEAPDKPVTINRTDLDGIRVDQVYTGRWFDLASVADLRSQELMDEYNRLLLDRLKYPEGERTAIADRKRELEDKLRQRLGSFMNTSLERLAFDLIVQESARQYPGTMLRDLTVEQRELLREKARFRLRQLKESHE